MGEEIVKNKHAEKLAGVVNRPQQAEDTYPTVVLVHGFGVTKEEGGMFDELADRLAENNFLVYRFDFSGCGESEGDYSQTSLTKLKDDLKVIIEYVKSQPEVDAQRIGVLAQSFGTATTVALHPDVNAIILMGSIYNLSVMENIFGKGYHPDGISTRKKSNGRVIKVGPQFWSEYKKYDLIDCIQQINCPLLFIHGSEDEKVPLENMEIYYQHANKPKRKVVLENANHSLKPKRVEMYQIAVDWFKKHL